MAEINVTPLVDVMLVLLIIFMVSAPLMQHGVQVNLPKTSASSMNESPKQVNLVLESENKIFLGSDPVRISELRQKLIQLSAQNPNLQIVIQASQSIPYGVIAEAITEVKNANIQQVGLATEPKR